MLKSVAVLDEQPAIGLGIREVILEDTAMTFLGSFNTINGFLQSFPEEKADENSSIAVILAGNLADDSQLLDNLDRLCALGFTVLPYLQSEETALVPAVTKRPCCNKTVFKCEPLAHLLTALCQPHGEKNRGQSNKADENSESPQPNCLLLSPNELRVLELYGFRGLPAKTVARQLGLTTNTVNTYVQRIRRAYAAQGRPASSRLDLYHRFKEDFPEYSENEEPQELSDSQADADSE
ncbi:helix-turn-helix transcriptional regulator [Varibaculum prostatecancerukia]|uniref:helix-turn-helix transcriptional regulator n=1 Tax=Varibaculum prostatecancerukia TaxID=2811781 RepID=UPI001C008E08|nr:sigma factor-like helix-turn-helix DNA-binding protein [Varibaculum prostatecancerukia]